MTKDEAQRLAKELEGVIADVEEGDGFDDVCLDTVKYVRDALLMAQPEQETVLPGGGHVPAVPVAVYGYCPECGGAGVMRERRPNGDDKCTNGHKYPSSKALAQPEQEPVAYSYTSRITGAQGFSHHPMPRFIDSESWDIKPLYTQQYTYIAPTHQKPFGWKLVPIEPTNEMLKAMDECSTEGYDERLLAGHASSVYMAAVDVAPTPPQPEQEPNKDGSLCPEFWDWLPKAYNFDGNGAFTKYNMEVAFLAGKQTSQPAQQEPVAKVVSTAPERIWLDLGFDPEVEDEISFDDLFEATWSHDNATGNGIEYVRADLAPASKPWVGLTDEEIYKIANDLFYGNGPCDTLAMCRAIEAAHGITGEQHG